MSADHHQRFSVMSPYTNSHLAAPFGPPAMSIDSVASPHHMSQMSPPNSSLLFSAGGHTPFGANGEFPHHRSFSNGHHTPSPHVPIPVHPGSLHHSSLPSSIGPQRVLTRRQARVQQQERQHEQQPTTVNQSSLSAGDKTAVENGTLESNQIDGFPAYPRPADLSRPHTPANLPNRNSFSSEQNCFSTDMSGSGQNGHSVMPHPAMSPPYPATPSTASSTYSHNSFGFHPYPTHGRSSHSRSTSGSTHPRSTSPATSIMSAGTSMSSVSSGQLRAPVSAASTTSSLHISSKPKKRLYNKERKAICLYYQEHPNVRQEDIAAQWGVERSTVSKILKQKEKWLHLPEDEEDQIAKHRPSKFPLVEEELKPWLRTCRETNTMISDHMIRTKAKEVALEMNIGEDKFKASAGWVENFKHRNNIRKGVWESLWKDTPPQEDSNDSIEQQQVESSDAAPQHPTPLQLDDMSYTTKGDETLTSMDAAALEQAILGSSDLPPLPSGHWASGQNQRSQTFEEAAAALSGQFYQPPISEEDEEVMRLVRCSTTPAVPRWPKWALQKFEHVEVITAAEARMGIIKAMVYMQRLEKRKRMDFLNDDEVSYLIHAAQLLHAEALQEDGESA